VNLNGRCSVACANPRRAATTVEAPATDAVEIGLHGARVPPEVAVTELGRASVARRAHAALLGNPDQHRRRAAVRRKIDKDAPVDHWEVAATLSQNELAG